jgi:hypothetical protein
VEGGETVVGSWFAELGRHDGKVCKVVLYVWLRDLKVALDLHGPEQRGPIRAWVLVQDGQQIQESTDGVARRPEIVVTYLFRAVLQECW